MAHDSAVAEDDRIRVRVVLGGTDELASQIYPGVTTFEGVEFTLVLDGAATLRAAVMTAVEPRLRSWLRETGMPEEAFTPTIFAGEGSTLTQLGQGFVIDASGRARATFDVAAEPWPDLARAYDHGLVPGDPRQLRVVLGVPTAGAGGAGWETFRDAAELLWVAWMTIGSAYDGYEGVREAVDRFQRATQALLRHQEDLEQRGFAPPDPVRLGSVKQWKVGELADMLGMSTDETVDLLTGFGFRRSDDGRWHSPPDLQKELAMILLRALTSYEAMKRDEDALRSRLQLELDAYASRASDASDDP
jgi:hypothetical protein